MADLCWQGVVDHTSDTVNGEPGEKAGTDETSSIDSDGSSILSTPMSVSAGLPYIHGDPDMVAGQANVAVSSQPMLASVDSRLPPVVANREHNGYTV
ncbi:uncharacterized protein LAESUDRAFT_728383 [Laetiporus sulphureus 93-53]|uniref:Uncharacterized protein n=1 Tax=Laetiporus sulphureus 93-53 TaxID=1314785 RepID=A0A165D4Z4_9APHY|nr:uncharacterized protein LAESUDRAFT_728383 [Laetiporus sulphureus 93-53]KZT04163.1 hypothetical protein LAESUDRAFT_728383 [Laetiporus sulphureus 93-53]